MLTEIDKDKMIIWDLLLKYFGKENGDWWNKCDKILKIAESG